IDGADRFDSVIKNTELELAYNFVQYTDKNIFLTGKAGTGKTTFLQEIKKNPLKRMITTAPTGVAAINAGGVTIHSFFQISFGPQITGLNSVNNSENQFRKFSREKINIIRSLDLLVIDEISMVRADLLDAVDGVLRRYKDPYEPFGGVQLLMIGDLQQLSPVIKDEEWRILQEHYESMYFFGSHALRQTDYVCIELRTVYRQTDNKFIDILNRVRENSADSEVLKELNRRYIPDFERQSIPGYITLTTHNSKANEINSFRLENLPEKEFSFEASVEGEFPEYSYPADFRLVLKEGSQVMFVKNDSSREKLFYNGKIGIIQKINPGSIEVLSPGEEQTVTVEKAVWENIKYRINEETKEIEETKVGTFSQYPLKLAWAITIHKSQGLTFEKAVIEADRAFTHGQIYVALSRCKSLEGLVLSSPIAARSIMCDPGILEYSRERLSTGPDERQFAEAKKQSERKLIMELFDFSKMGRQLGYFIRLLSENQGSILESLSEPFFLLNPVFKTEILETGDKFKLQLQKYIRQDNEIENNEILQEKTQKASLYFKEKLETALLPVLENADIETDSQSVRKVLTEALQKLKNEAVLKLSCIRLSVDGFSAFKYMETRAKASLDLRTENENLKKKKPSGIESVSTEKAKDLFEILKNWRNKKAEKKNTQPFMILQQNVLISLAKNLPLTIPELKKIHGIGDKKVKEFGEEIIQIIGLFCSTGGSAEEIRNAEISENREMSEKNTKGITLEMFKSGKSPSEIAEKRNLTVATVESHLAFSIETGDLEITALMDQDKIKFIADYFRRTSLKALGPAKAELGENVSYAELKYVLKHMEYAESVNKAG
ncbi:MAG TPA: helix-turn-helix domain-containing protein, partial [Leptospiraceae bacterium]|nr:helix-turn-helix domain-containing protein [Leptospiraceae bacterium]